MPLPLRHGASFAIVAMLVLAGALAVSMTVEGDEPPPAAVAGEDRRLECTSPAGATVPLDASASRVGPNASAVSYAWYEDHNTSAQRKLGEGPRVNATLPLGSHDVTLVIRLQREVTVTNETDGNVTTYQANETLLDTLTVEVVDTTAPVITATASRASLWPPNHKLVPIEVEVHVEDVCAPSPSWSLASATSDEDADGKGDGHTAVDLLDVQPGTQDTSFQLRSERAGSGDGRAYTLTYEARDPSGNVVRKDVVVSVPHDMG